MTTTEIADILRKVAKAPLTDGAKVTFLLFAAGFLDGSKEVPSYTTLALTRKMVRSAVQAHVVELENWRLLESVRRPDNSKRYVIRWERLDVPQAQYKKLPKKPVGTFTTWEIGRYFLHKLQELGGKERELTGEEKAKLKFLHRRHSSAEIVKGIDKLAERYSAKRVGGFSIEMLDKQFS